MLGSRFARGGCVAALMCCFALGCGGKGNRVSGTVKFKGQPVPAGKIYFTPDSSKGNKGAAGYADIKDGKYDTAAPGGRGAVAGPVVIAIEGYDPNAKPEKDDKSAEAGAKPLFPRYETKAELPDAESTKDIDVPANAPQPKQGGEIIP